MSASRSICCLARCIQRNLSARRLYTPIEAKVSGRRAASFEKPLLPQGAQQENRGCGMLLGSQNPELEAAMNPGWIACIAVVILSFLGEIVFKPYLKAYAEEKGKRLATKEDIDNVLEQVRAVTRETEIIKAEISGGLWQQQWHLTQKRDCYTRLVDALENIQLQRSSLRRAADGVPRAEARQRVEDAILEFRRARALARLILPPEVISGIGRLLRALGPFNPETCTDDEMANSKKLITSARDRVVGFGRRELGLVKEG